MIQYTVCDATTGEIIRTGETATLAQAQLQGNTPGTKVLTVGSDPATQVVQNPGGAGAGVGSRPAPGMVADKTSIVANGVDAITISNVPANAKARFTVPDNAGFDPVADLTVTDGTLSVTTTVAGSYSITIASFPAYDFKVTFNAV